MDVEEQDLGWHYDGFHTFIDTQSYKNPDGFSSVSHSESVQEKNTRRSRLIKISVFWMVVLMLALIIFIIYISNYRDSKIRYYTSEITLTIKQDYTATLGNKNSQEYRELTSQLCSQMEKTFKRSNSYGSNYQFCEVKNLRSGSIIVTFMLYFTDTVDVTNEEVYRIINSSITVVNSTTIFAEYVIDAADISISTTIAVYGRDPLPYLISNSVLPVTQIPSSTVPETTVETTSPQSTSGTSPTLSTSTTTPTTSITFKTTQSTSTTSTTTPTTSTTSKTTQSLSTTSGTTPMLSTTSGTISTLSPTPETTSTETKSNSEPSTAVTVQTSSTTTSAVQNTIPFSTTVQKTSSQSTTVKVTLIASTTQQTTSASYTSLTATTNPSTTVQTTSPDNQTILQSSTTVHGAPSTTTQETSTTYPTFTYTSTSSGTVDTTSTPSSTKTTSTLSSTVQSTLPLSSTVQTTSLSSTAARTMITSLTTAGTTSSAADQSMTTENTPSSSSTTRTAAETKEAEITTELSTTTEDALTTTTLITSSTLPPDTAQSVSTPTTSTPTTTETLKISTTSPTPITTETLKISTTSPTPITTETLKISSTSPTPITIGTPSTSTTSSTTKTKLPTPTTTETLKIYTTSPTPITTGTPSTSTTSSTTKTELPTPTTTETLKISTTSPTPITTETLKISTTSPTPTTTGKPSTSTTSSTTQSVSTSTTSPPTTTTETVTTSTTFPTTLSTTEILTSTTVTSQASPSTTKTLTSMPKTSPTSLSTTDILTTSSPLTTRAFQSTTLETLTTSPTSPASRTETTTMSSLPTETSSASPFSIFSTLTQFTDTTLTSTQKPTENLSITTPDNTTYTSLPTQTSNNTKELITSVTVEPTTKSTTENLDSSFTKVTTPQSTAENLDSSSTKVTTPQSTTENLDSSSTKATTSQSTTENLDSSSTKVTTPQSTTENLDSSSTKVTTSQSTTENLDSSSSYVTTSRSTTENIIQTTQIALSTTNTTDNSTLTSETPPGTTTMVTETTTGAPISTANISFPSVTVLAREDLALECTIDVVENWDTVIASRELGTSSSVLALLSSNGTESHPTKSDLTSVTFTRHTDRITVVFHVKLATAVICPSLLRFKCGITMADIAETVIMKISDAEITAPINNVTLDMKTTYYSGERVELTCRTTTDYEYGQISLEVRLPDGSVLQDPAKRSMYESPRNSDCSVDFEWNYKTSFPMELALNGSVIRCIASNTLLNKTAVASEVVTVLQSDVSFTQYHVAAKPGERVSIHCQTSVATSAINSISIYKISNNTNATIANYANGVLTDSPGRSVTFEDGELKVEYINLQCSDEGQYFCTVTTGSSVIASPLPLTLQPTVEAGSTPVSLSLHVDVVEDTFHYTSEHSCSGEVGYPDVSGFLSLTISNPTTGETAIFNEKVISDAMKVYDSSVSSSLYLYSVLLADGLMLLVKENTTRQESCSSTHSLKFYLNASREWNEGKIRCEIQTEDASVQSSVVEETLYVIPVDVCEQFNETKVFFIDHEKFDNCNTYIQCEKNQPHGRKCAVRQCVYIGKAYCDDCSRAICTESPTTPISTTSTSTLSTTVTKAAKYVECTSSSVYQNELASISCHLNVSTFHSLNVSKNQVIIAFIRSDGTVAVLPEYSDKLHVSFSLSAQRVDVSIPSMSCSDDAKYSVVMEIENEDTIATTFAIVMKVKPNPPLITLHADLIDGQNQRTHSCTGDVGHPVGELEIQIKRPGETEFKNYHPANQKRVYSLSSKNCSNVQTMNFSIDLTADSWSNVTVRCVAFNPESLNSTDIVPSSTEYTISSVPSDYCSNKNSTYYEQHPMGCPYYVWCVTGRPYGYVCATKNLCINTESGHCV